MSAGCAVGPDFVRPQAPGEEGYVPGSEPAETVTAEGTAQRLVAERQIRADWWRLLSSPALDAIVDEAFARNPGVGAAQARLRASEDARKAGLGVFFPQIDAQASASRQQSNPRRIGLSLPSSTYNLFTVSGSVSYSLDLWGGERRALEGLTAQVEAQRCTVLGTYLILSSNVVNAAIAQAGYRDQLRDLTELLQVEREQLSVTEAQAEAGTIPYVNVVSLRAQMASTEASLPPLRQRIDETDHLLAVLAGRTPASWQPRAFTLADFTLPAELPLSLPSALVRQRPDILVAEAQLHAANAQIGVTTAAMLPNITLGVSGGLANPELSQLFSSASTFWGLTAGLTQPLFHGGTLYYQHRQSIDQRDEAAETYRQTVLTAFQQVADILRALAHDAEEVEAQSRAVAAADEALKLVDTNYQTGIATYVQLLVANTQVQQARLAFIQAKAQRLQDTVALLVALGGGWWNAPESASASTSRPAATPPGAPP